MARAKIAGSSVDQRRFGSAQRVRAELERVEADAGDPLAYKAGVLACREPPVAVATSKQERAGLPAGQSEILLDGLPRLLGEFEPDRAPRLLLADRRSIERVAVGGYVIDTHRNDITAAQFAVDGEVEQREIADAALELQPCPDRPDVACSEAASHRSACLCSRADGAMDCWMGLLRRS